ncbi:MAG: hypothetical protein ACYCYP_13260 [Leptospirales bacterium]
MFEFSILPKSIQRKKTDFLEHPDREIPVDLNNRAHFLDTLRDVSNIPRCDPWDSGGAEMEFHLWARD